METRKTTSSLTASTTTGAVVPKCERTTQRGYVINFGSGSRLTVSDEPTASRIYRDIKGSKALSVYDGGYIIPLLSE